MVMDVRVVGVGMTPFAKPGASESYVEMGSKAVKAALADAGLPYSAVQQAYAGYVYGDFDLRPGRSLPGWNDRYSDHQCPQQLLDRLDGAVSGAPGCCIGCCGLCARRRLRGNAPGHAGFKFPRSIAPDASAGRTDGRSAGEGSQGPAGRPVLRWRRRGIRQEVRYPRHHVCEDRCKGAPARRQQSLCDLPHAAVGRRNSCFADAIRPDHALSMLPPNLRSGSCDCLLAVVRRAPWA